jgi:hypothetical protein
MDGWIDAEWVEEEGTSWVFTPPSSLVNVDHYFLCGLTDLAPSPGSAVFFL